MGYVTICERCGSETRLYDHGLTGAVQVIGAGAQPCRACLKKEIAGLQSKLAEEKNIAACRKLVADNLEKEVERLRKQCQLADSQFSQIATTVGGDARHYEGGGEQTIANFVKQEVERLRGLIVEFVAADDQLSPSKSMGSADHKRTIDRWEAAIKALKGAAVTKGET